MIPDNEKIYLDANFIVFWLLKKSDQKKKRAQKMLALMLSKNCEMYISALAMDEAWNGFRKKVDAQKPMWDEGVMDEIEKTLPIILQSTRAISFQNPQKGIEKAFENISQYQLRPRDSFHVALMQEHGLEKIMTNDDKFDKRVGFVEAIKF